MEITEVRIKLMEDPQERLQAFCSITINGSFVIRDLKIIEGLKGSFVAMPSRKLTDRCPQCGAKNHLRAGFCNQCGVKLMEDRATKDTEGRARLYADIAHPINSRCRELIQETVITAFQQEQIKAQQPGYVCRYDDFGEDGFAELAEPMSAGSTNGTQATRYAETYGGLVPRPGSDGQLRIDPAGNVAENIPAPHASATHPSQKHQPTGARDGLSANAGDGRRNGSFDDDFGNGVLGSDS